MTTMDLQNSLLRRSIELLESGWTQGQSARDENGRPVPIGHQSACEWCATGALFTADIEMTNDLHASLAMHQAMARVVAAARQRHHEALITWNDAPNRTVDQVIDVFRKALEKGERA